ncbi:uncharacterized protein BDW70DRAFT_131263 [Aspergillus foveolatus]|uniref:uncharacterized protein n=1 Tax=Aspergillus foveolatus TaxID=210207 RepID=UPI003CCD1359
MANIDTVRFISRDLRTERTPTLEAAALLQQLQLDTDEAVDDGVDRNQWVQNQIMKVEQLFEFLLDKGYSAKDTAPPFQNNVGAWSQPRDSVLGLVVSRAGKALVQQLINQGADITLHLANLLWNADVG